MEGVNSRAAEIVLYPLLTVWHDGLSSVRVIRVDDWDADIDIRLRREGVWHPRGMNFQEIAESSRVLQRRFLSPAIWEEMFF